MLTNNNCSQALRVLKIVLQFQRPRSFSRTRITTQYDKRHIRRTFLTSLCLFIKRFSSKQLHVYIYKDSAEVKKLYLKQHENKKYFTLKAAQKRCTVVMAIQKSIGKWKFRPPPQYERNPSKVHYEIWHT